MDDQTAGADRVVSGATVVCCVRNPAWVIDSIEPLIRHNAFEPSGIFNYEPEAPSIHGRRARRTGMVGFAWNALREAVYGGHADRLFLVRYESLTANPLGALAAIYNFIGEPLYAHDPEQYRTRLRGDGIRRAGSARPGCMRLVPAVQRPVAADDPAARSVRPLRGRRVLAGPGQIADDGACRLTARAVAAARDGCKEAKLAVGTGGSENRKMGPGAGIQNCGTIRVLDP